MSLAKYSGTSRRAKDGVRMSTQDYVLCCESTADMPASFFEDNHIPYACFHFLMDDEEFPDDLGQSMSFEHFYYRISEGAMPTTSAINSGEYIQTWTPFLEAGHDILHISFSSGLSSSYETAVATAKELKAKYPERTILVIDSRGASSGYGMLVALAHEQKQAGLSLEELAAWVKERRLHIHHWFFSTDLSSYLRGGRISRRSAMLGTLLNICPLLNMNDEGKLIPRSKIRTKKKAMLAMVEEMEQHAQDGHDYHGHCYLSNSACRKDAEDVAALIRERFPHIEGEILINSVGTVIGTHTGPGTVALFFEGDERTN